MVSPPAGHKQSSHFSLIVNPSISVSCCFQGGGHASGPTCDLPASPCDLFFKPEGPQNKSLLPFFRGATCSHFKLSQRSAAYSNIQQNYETKGPRPLRVAPVSRITSQTHSPATKLPLCDSPALELAAGATARLTGPDSADSIPDLSPDLLPVLPLQGIGRSKSKHKIRINCGKQGE